MTDVVAVILAAGQGKRMHSRLPKVLHRTAGRSLIEHVLTAIKEADVAEVVIVVGHGAEQVTAALEPGYKYAIQEQQLGTGHALFQARDVVGKAKTILALCGDTPLIRSKTITGLIECHQKNQAAVTVLTAMLEEPHGYGRIIRDEKGDIKEIVEERDASDEVKRVNEINAGIYCFSASFLWPSLAELKPDNEQQEYYLTDVVKTARVRNLPVKSFMTDHAEEIMGVNDRLQLSRAGVALKRRINEVLMLAGVTIVDPETTYIDPTVLISPDTVVYPGTYIEGNTVINPNCSIGPGATIRNCRIGTGSVVMHTVAVESVIGDNCQVGPFAFLRPGTVLEAGVKVGDFVEIKASHIGPGSKVPHLTYLGDTTVGAGVNIGAGTIICNYDGRNKWKTIIEERAFIGSNANLVAPVKVGAGAVVGAGSTITKDVPAGMLALARGRQINLPPRGKKDGENRQEKE